MQAMRGTGECIMTCHIARDNGPDKKKGPSFQIKERMPTDAEMQENEEREERLRIERNYFYGQYQEA